MNLKLKERRISGRSTNLLMNQIVKEFIENTPTWVEEEMERLDKYWTEETIKFQYSTFNIDIRCIQRIQSF